MEHRAAAQASENPTGQGFLDTLDWTVALALPVSAFWYLLSTIEAEGLLPLVLIIATLGLAVGLGVSREAVVGFVMSLVVVGGIVVGVFLGAGDLSENPEDGPFFIVLFAVVMTILVLAFWLVGIGVARVRRRVSNR
jgi:hypothetical protein